MYLGSVGRISTLILGVSPDDRGLLPDADVKRLKEFGQEIKRRYDTPLAFVEGEGKRLQMKLPAETKICALAIAEDIRLGERVRSYKVEGKVKGKWVTLATGSCIGHKRLEEITPVEVSAVRLRINESLDQPVITDFSIYAY